MTTPIIRILLTEDNAADAELVVRELKRVELRFAHRVVDSEESFTDALHAFVPDVILSDFSMPGFDGEVALALAREICPDTPFIFVSGTIGEESAIQALKSGAADYVMKTNLVRLPAAVERAIQERRERSARRDTESALRASELRKSAIIEAALDCFITIDAQGCVIEFNPAAEKTFGYAREEVLGKELTGLIIPAGLHASHRQGLKHYHATGEGPILGRRIEVSAMRKDRSEFPVELTVVPIRLPDRMLFSAYIRDITERKRAEADLVESEERFRQLAENIKEVFWLTDPSKNEMLYISPTYEEIWGRSRQSLYAVPRDWAEAIHLDDRGRVLEAAQTRQIAGEYVEEYRIVRPDGSMRWIRDRAFPVTDKDGNVIRIAGVAEDVTERKEQEHRIARLSRIHAVLSGINSAIVRIRDRQELFKEACRIAVEHGGFSIGWLAVLDHESGKLVTVAQAGLPMDCGTGGDPSNRPAGLMPRGTAEIALREKRPAFDNDIERGIAEMKGEVAPDTVIQLGAKSMIVLPLYAEGKTFGILTLYAPERNFFDDEELKLLNELAGDISFGLEFIAKEEKVDYLAYYDTLTGLPNRSLFFDRLTHQLGAAARDGMKVALVLTDLNRFRLINDTLGRQAGDALLSAVAERITETVSDQDTVARLGADRFAMTVSGRRMGDVAHVLEAGNDALFGQPFLLGQEELRVSATAGIAVFPGDGDNPEKLFANAEAALRKAKEQNARLLFYGPEMNARIADSLRLENRLRRALENGEMVLWYQPKVSVKTRKLTGFEALMRWQDPESGMVPPAKFIPLMEQTGLILEAGRWAMSQVARDCKLWATGGFKPPRVAVNVSPIQLRQKDFVATVVEAAARMEEAGSMLDLEITESVIMENVEAIIPILQTVRGLGVEIAVDDFGTGYSSLAYIARLPIHDLKIDRSFVVGMTQNEDSLIIVKSVISLAHSLRLNVVAEGVETEEQAALLLKLGCDEMQGYLFSAPVPPAEVPGYLSRKRSAAIRPARRR
jgi:diguanylate cyclase (GGDEF)-like protein/PAS domain S-box-containing protein